MPRKRGFNKAKMKNPLHKQMIDLFHSWYEKEKGIKFIWDAKQTRQIDLIYDKLYHLCKFNEILQDDANISHLFEKMLSNLKEADKWIYENVSPALISSKFNELVAKIRSMRTGKGNYQDLKVDLISKMFKS